jgi:hypothetical protein
MCGSAVGQLSPRQTAALVQERAQAKRARRAARQRRARGALDKLASGVRRGGRGIAAACLWLQKLPGRTDRLLLRIAGEEQDETRLLHRFLRCLVIGLFVGALTALVFLMVL